MPNVVAQSQVSDQRERGQQGIGIGQQAEVVLQGLEVYLRVQVSQQTVACGPSIPIQEILEARRQAARQDQRAVGVPRKGLRAVAFGSAGKPNWFGMPVKSGNCAADGRRHAAVGRGPPPQEAARNKRIEVIDNVFSDLPGV